MSKKRLIAAGAALYGASVAGFYYYASSRAPQSVKGGDENDNVDVDAPSTSTFSTLASTYDSRIDLEETLMGLKLLRRFTLGGRGGATGDVLEVCGGTGRNLKYYRKSGGVSSVTLVEPSKEMLAEARQKAMSIAEKSGGDLPRVNFVLASAEELVGKGERGNGTVFGPGDAVDVSSSSPPPLPRPGRVAPSSFDTVVDTFGLCSIDTVEKAEEAVREMAKACKAGGKLIFIEHGRARSEPSDSSRSSNSSPPLPFTKEWIDAKLDAGAREHRKKWGCWFNRDVEGIVRRGLSSAAKDGGDAEVDVESLRRWHFGTTVVIEARPRERRGEEEEHRERR